MSGSDSEIIAQFEALILNSKDPIAKEFREEGAKLLVKAKAGSQAAVSKLKELIEAYLKKKEEASLNQPTTNQPDPTPPPVDTETPNNDNNNNPIPNHGGYDRDREEDPDGPKNDQPLPSETDSGGNETNTPGDPSTRPSDTIEPPPRH